MNWIDENGVRRHIYASGAARLALVAANAPVGRRETGSPAWRHDQVSAFEDQGLWTVDWLEAGDTERTGAWSITGLTAKGRSVLAEWQRRVEEGGGRRGPKRG